MNYNRLHILLMGCMIITAGHVQAREFRASSYPLLMVPYAKPNIHLVLGDVGNINSEKDMFVPEHAEGFGRPTCTNPSEMWHLERERLGEYDPMANNGYQPWDDAKAVDGLINGKKKPPPILKCARVTRADAMIYAYKRILYKYRTSADLSASTVSTNWVLKNDYTNTDYASVLAVESRDYSRYNLTNFNQVVFAPVYNLLNNTFGPARSESSYYPAIYEIIKYFRGQPMTENGILPSRKHCDKGKEASKRCWYSMARFVTPLKYRCQKSHMLTVFAAKPDYDVGYGIALEDDLPISRPRDAMIIAGVNLSSQTNINPGGGFWGSGVNYYREDLSRISRDIDFRKSLKTLDIPGDPGWNGAQANIIQKKGGRCWNGLEWTVFSAYDLDHAYLGFTNVP